MTPWRAALASMLVGLAFAMPALAEPTSDERALALTLFARGREAMNGGDLETACRSFAESQRLDPGGGTLLNLAVCHERQGKTATAWTEYSEALAAARRDGRSDRVDLALERKRDLEGRLSRLEVVVPADVPREGLRIVRDGTAIPVEAWGVGVPVDPGEHSVVAFVADTRVFETVVTVGASATGTVTVVSSAASSAPPLAREERRAPTDRAIPRADGARMWAGWGAVGGGAVLAGVGTIFGVRALSAKRESDEACIGGRCSSASVEANDRAKSYADVSTATFVTAAVAVGVGVYLLVTGERAAR